MSNRSVQKTDKLKKPLQTDRIAAKISVRFRFGSVLLHKKPKILVRFSVADLNVPNRTEIYYYIIILYIILNIYSIKFVTWAWAWPCQNYSSPLPIG